MLRDGSVVSVQVLNALAHVARRKMGMGWGELRTVLSLARGLVTVLAVSPETHEAGLGLAERYGFRVGIR